MINYLWECMILIGVAYGIAMNRAEQVGTGIINSATEAVELVIGMLGIVALWCGFMEIAREVGIMRKLTCLLRRPIEYLFPGVERDSKAAEYIAANMVANMLGLGWAATPSGLQAMRELKKNHEEYCRRKKEEAKKQGRKLTKKEEKRYSTDTASTDMCTFLIINISSLQLIPVNIIAYRSRYGSVNPAAIVGVGLLATLFSTCIGILFAKIMGDRDELYN
ncbi:MAG: nucleoside recognition protein [Lachnospiraceae bacterium]